MVTGKAYENEDEDPAEDDFTDVDELNMEEDKPDVPEVLSIKVVELWPPDEPSD